MLDEAGRGTLTRPSYVRSRDRSGTDASYFARLHHRESAEHRGGVHVALEVVRPGVQRVDVERLLAGPVVEVGRVEGSPALLGEDVDVVRDAVVLVVERRS